MRRVALAVCLSTLYFTANTRADEVHLTNGTVIEGQATRRDDKVVIVMESGEISLPADSVKKIESSESNIDIYEKRYAQLNAHDIKARLALADFCRDHDMRSREQTVLREVVSIDADNEQARTRLGYVKTDSGWVAYDDAMRARGMVQVDGHWASAADALEIERLRAQTETARHERDKAQVELDTQKVQLEKAREAAVAQAKPAPAPQPVFMYGLSYRDLREAECTAKGTCGRRAHNVNNPTFNINGVRDPRDPRYLMPPGVRDPRTGI